MLYPPYDRLPCNPTHLGLPEEPLRNDPLLTGDDAARELRCAPGTLNSRRSRNLPTPRAFKLAQMVRYRLSDVRRVIDMESGHPVRLVPTYSDDKVLTRKEAAAYLAIPESTLATWRSRQPGYGPPDFKLGARAMYRLSDLNRWVDDHLEPSRAAS